MATTVRTKSHRKTTQKAIWLRVQPRSRYPEKDEEPLPLKRKKNCKKRPSHNLTI